jgi:transcriptional regulator with XRE-family HTH domain
MRIGLKIRELRQAKGWTEWDLSRACGLGPAEALALDASYIFDFESGFNLPSGTSMMKIAAALGVELKVLDECEFAGVLGVERWKYQPEPVSQPADPPKGVGKVPQKPSMKEPAKAPEQARTVNAPAPAAKRLKAKAEPKRRGA